MSGDAFRHRPRKRFGQNFLHDPHIIERIIASLQSGPDQQLIEIGPGKGALTAPLLERFGSLQVIEVDRDLAAFLRLHLGHHPGFRLHCEDVLKLDFNQFVEETGRDEPPLVIIGNLPYNISTPLIFHLLSFRSLIADMYFMLQLEVVQRLAAAPGTEHYGRLSIMAQYHCRVEMLFTVPSGAFSPPPRVESALVRLSPYRSLPCPARDPRMLDRVVRAAFAQRRKTLRNCLKALLSGDQLAGLGIDPGERAENLSLHDYVRISDFLTQSIQSTA